MNPYNISYISFVTSSQDQTILHFSIATTPQSFFHFERMPSGSIGDPSRVLCRYPNNALLDFVQEPYPP
jgi:hypothetical protein